MNQFKNVARRSTIALAIAACMTMGAVGTAAASSPFMGDQATADSQQPVTDTWITTKVKTELATTKNVSGTDISVDTVNGVVHLTGNLASDMERNKAVAAARRVKGVKSVDAGGLKASGSATPTTDHMTNHDAASDSDQPVTDTWITTKVKAELATTKDVSGTAISVDTVNGAVHLSGNLSSDIERKKAIASARSVKGVKSVDASGLKATGANSSSDRMSADHANHDSSSDSDQPVTDTWITTKVKAELATTKNVSGTDISVETVNGVVHLTGNLASDVERKKAVAATQSVKGVKSVDASGLKASGSAVSSSDRMTSNNDSSSDSDQPVTDTWITTKVKAELATTKDVSGTDISVETVNGSVHLTGNLASDIERKKAIAATKSVKGVKAVDASGLKSAH